MVVQIVLLSKSTLSLNEDQQTNDKRNLLILFEFSYFYFLSHSFGIETINTFTRSRSSVENHTQFPGQTKMGNIYNHFQTKPNQKPHPLARHIPYIAYVRDYPLDPHVQVTSFICVYKKLIKVLCQIMCHSNFVLNPNSV